MLSWCFGPPSSLIIVEIMLSFFVRVFTVIIIVKKQQHAPYMSTNNSTLCMEQLIASKKCNSYQKLVVSNMSSPEHLRKKAKSTVQIFEFSTEKTEEIHILPQNKKSCNKDLR